MDIIFTSGVDLDNRTCAGLPVVIMAGGLGTRLYPYTKILPKPLIPVGERPILELIIDRFCDFGCTDFHLVVNYKKNMIKSYFNDLEKSYRVSYADEDEPLGIIDRFCDFGCTDFHLVVNYKKNMIKSYFNDLEKSYRVSYADEDEPLGTGGGLCLLKGKLDNTFFLSNCDILLDADYGDILNYHKSQGNIITMVCAVKHFTVPYGVLDNTFFLSNCDILLDADYGDILNYHKSQGNIITMVCAVKHFTVPYGVIELNNDGTIQTMREKPEMNFLTNTGVYVVEPRVVEELEDGKKQGFTDIIEHYRGTIQTMREKPEMNFLTNTGVYVVEPRVVEELEDGKKQGFTDIIEHYRAIGEKVGVYPISEQSWMDMGQIEELDHMRRRLEGNS